MSHQNNKSIIDFLLSHKCDDNTYTHVSMNKGKYKITNDDITEFYELFNQARENNEPLYIVERHNEYGPVIVDIDLKYNISTIQYETMECKTNDRIIKRLYDENDIKDIITLYRNEIKKIFNMDENDNRLRAYVFERPAPYVPGPNKNGALSNIYKDGIHIMFMEIITNFDTQYYIRNNVLNNIDNILTKLNLYNTPSDVIDSAVIENNGWLMYGCNKPNVSCDPYYLSHIYEYDFSELDSIDVIGFEDAYPNFFSIRNYVKESTTPIESKQQLDEIEEFMQQKHKNKGQSSISVGNKRQSNVIMKRQYTSPEDIKFIGELIQLYNQNRANSYNSIMQVGWALHNVNPDSTELLEIWDNFYKNSSYYADNANELWGNMRNEGYSIASLYYWAKNDNLEGYNQLMSKHLDTYILTSLETHADYDVAKVLKQLHKHDFKYCNDEWYMYKNHRWNKINKKGFEVRTIISNELRDLYRNKLSVLNAEYMYKRSLLSESDTDGMEALRKETKEKQNNIGKMTTKLGCDAFKSKVINGYSEECYDDGFYDKLDTNPFLIGFVNGVYDLIKKEFRDGCPDDYISLSTNIKYVPFSKNDSNWTDLQRFIDTVFIEEDVRDYVLRVIASCLQGYNQEQKFRFWTGVGGNGKSKLNELIQHCFGDYATSLPVTYLTGKVASSHTPQPEIIKTKGRRFIYMDEPENESKINNGLMKKITGGDKIEARDLFKSPIIFTPQFKTFLLCNQIPTVPAHDGGTWRRMECIEFKTQFKTNPDPNNKYEVEIDNNLSLKMIEWPELFMSYLLDVYYPLYKQEGIIVPYEILKFTNEFKSKCDIYHDFIATYLVDVFNPNITDNILLSFNDMYTEFKNWYKTYIDEQGFKVPSQKQFKEYIISVYRKERIVNNMFVKGLKIKVKGDDGEIINNEEEKI